MGFSGKWAIHPSQIEIINAAFSPTQDEIGRAQAILAALAEAGNAGRGACVVDGKMVDAASIRQAQGLIETATVLGLISAR
jgi:malyl-CoA/(S)-citramalyl-CoA lyase